MMLTVLGVLTAMGAIDYGIVTAGLGSGLAMAMLQWFIPVLGTRRAVLNLMRDIPVLGETKAGLTPTRLMLCTVMKPLTYLQCLLVFHQFEQAPTSRPLRISNPAKPFTQSEVNIVTV